VDRGDDPARVSGRQHGSTVARVLRERVGAWRRCPLYRSERSFLAWPRPRSGTGAGHGTSPSLARVRREIGDDAWDPPVGDRGWRTAARAALGHKASWAAGVG
jgi:hypothetical protein